jgi:DNA-binding FrmR family transcriptional regulator
VSAIVSSATMVDALLEEVDTLVVQVVAVMTMLEANLEADTVVVQVVAVSMAVVSMV